MTDSEAIPLHARTIALVGLMGVGKSTVGRRLARRLGLPFADGDEEIESAAGMTVSDIFASLGEGDFRAGEARVMRRLLEGPRLVLATGGGAMLNAETRGLMKTNAVTVWMRADLETIAQRVARRDTRPAVIRWRRCDRWPRRAIRSTAKPM
jgi:shikimate kinase